MRFSLEAAATWLAWPSDVVARLLDAIGTSRFWDSSRQIGDQTMTLLWEKLHDGAPSRPLPPPAPAPPAPAACQWTLEEAARLLRVSSRTMRNVIRVSGVSRLWGLRQVIGERTLRLLWDRL